MPAIVQGLKKSLEEAMAPETGDGGDPGTREAALTVWDSQKDLLKQRIDEVMPVYDRLLVRAKEAMQK